MTDHKKFEEMLERLVNEDREGAEALFHEIVVERSRDIYQSILESDDDEDLDENEDEDLDETEDEDLDETEDDDDKELEESTDEDEDLDETEDEDLDEMFGLDEFSMGGDATDDMLGDIGMDQDGEGDDEEGDDMGMDDMGGEEEGDIEGRVEDLEDVIEKLQAEFDAIMGGEGDDEEGDDMEMDGDEEGDDMEMGGDDEDDTEEAFAYESEEDDDDEVTETKKVKKEDEKKTKKTAGEEMREYVEKITGGGLDSKKIGGDNGTNSKSIVAGKNDMGGTTQNILRSDTEQGVEAAKGQLKGSAHADKSPKAMNTKNINVPGGKAGKTGFKKTEPGHGAEKKGKPESADKGAVSTLTKVSSRAK